MIFNLFMEYLLHSFFVGHSEFPIFIVFAGASDIIIGTYYVVWNLYYKLVIRIKNSVINLKK